MERRQDLAGKTVVVTGATSGIGQATAQALALRGAWAIGVGRSDARCEAARERVLAAAPGARISFVVADLSALAAVHELAVCVRALLHEAGETKLDVLINGAGTVSSWRTVTDDGYELQFAVNHLAPFLLTMELMRLLEAAPSSRVITISSGSHYRTKMHWDDVMYRRGYQVLKSYKQSKLANVLFTAEFNRRYRDRTGVRAYAADPGLVNTTIGLKGTHGLAKLVWARRSARGASSEDAAEAIVHLATDPEVSETEGIYWKDCRPKQPSTQARDEAAAARLWALSARLCGLD